MVTIPGVAFRPFKSLPPSAAFPFYSPPADHHVIHSYFMVAYCSTTPSRGHVVVMLAVLGTGTALALPVALNSVYVPRHRFAANLCCPRGVMPMKRTSRNRFLEACLLRRLVARDGLARHS